MVAPLLRRRHLEVAWPVHGSYGPLAWYVRAVRHRGQLRLAKYLTELAASDSMVVVVTNGARLRIDPADFISWYILVEGSWEPKTLALASRLMAGGGTFVDVGAAFGLYTCALGVLPGVKCVAVEAAAPAFLRLQRNLALNPSVDANVFNLAVGPERGLERLTFPQPQNQGQARILPGQDALGHYVATVPLQEILDRSAIGPVKLMKLDIEGLEMSVLGRLDWEAATRPEHLIMELNDASAGRGFSAADVVRFFQERGYEVQHVDGRPFAPGDPLIEDNLWIAQVSRG